MLRIYQSGEILLSYQGKYYVLNKDQIATIAKMPRSYFLDSSNCLNCHIATTLHSAFL